MTKAILQGVWGLLLSLLLHAVSFANDDVVESTRQSIIGASGPSSTSAGPGGANKVSVDASSDKTTASSQLTYDWIAGKALLSGNLMGEAPITDNKSNMSNDLGSVSALTAGVNERLSLWGGKLPGGQSAAETKYLNDNCTAFRKAVLGKDAYAVYLNMPGTDLPAISCADLARNASSALPDLIKRINAAQKKINKDAPDLHLQPDWVRAAKEAQFNLDNVPALNALNLFGVSIVGNQQKYSYVTTAAPSNIVKQNTEGYGIGLSYMRVMPSASLILGYSYERAYMGGKGEQVCKPIGTSSDTTCSSATVGAPTLTTANIVSAEIRFLVAGMFALGPRVEYDATGHNTGIKLPIYMRTTSAKSFSGGVQIGWTSEAHFQGALVLQKAFSFFD
jgi:hypothetical protein